MKQANFLYFYIACLVSGSILGMNRKMLIQGLFRMIIPMLLEMICAMAVGTLVGVRSSDLTMAVGGDGGVRCF